MKFVMEYRAQVETKAELCRKYGISRPTGDLWIARFTERGVAGLLDRSRAPHRHPNQMNEEIEAAILELRGEHPRWGPKKLRAKLEQRRPRTPWPALSTIGELLRREGLTTERKKRRRTPPYTQPFVSVDECNQVWCMDFKGWFRTADGQRIDPFTLTDAHSRYLLRCQAVNKTDGEQVRRVLEASFREYGLPVAIRSDNGAPFASRAIAGLSRLAIYLMKLDITPERIQAGHPEQNGRHERMHRTLQAETASPPRAHRRAQQAAFNEFRREYNDERPHEALGQKTPASCYCSSPRSYPARLREPEYDSQTVVRRVYNPGTFGWKNKHVFLSETLIGEAIGLQAIDDRFYRLVFGRFPLGRFDSHTGKTEAMPKSETEPQTR